MPFSPRWLIHHDREDEAKRILSTLRDLPIDHELVELEFLEIKAQSLFEKRSIAEQFPHLREQTPWNNFKLQFVAIKSLFQKKSMFKRCIIAGVTMFFQQVSFYPIADSLLLVKLDLIGIYGTNLARSGRESTLCSTMPLPSSSN